MHNIIIIILLSFSGNIQAQDIEKTRYRAEQGYADAQYNLGILYANGQGVRQNYVEAEKWYRKSAEQGHTDAQNALGTLYGHGHGVIRNFSETAKWYHKAAAQGHIESQRDLGHLYRSGKGVPKDLALAAKWYSMAVAQGDSASQKSLKSMKNDYRTNIRNINDIAKGTAEGIRAYNALKSDEPSSTNYSQANNKNNTEYKNCYNKVSERLIRCSVGSSCDITGCQNDAFCDGDAHWISSFTCTRAINSSYTKIRGDTYCDIDSRKFDQDKENLINSICLK